MATRVFTAFDYDHDEFLRTALVGQSRLEDSPFEICDYSVKEPFTGDWKKKVRERIKKCGQMIVICGEHTHEAYLPISCRFLANIATLGLWDTSCKGSD